MTLRDAAADHWGKFVVGVASSVLLYLLTNAWTWLHDNVVFASDLERLTKDITQAVQKEIAPVIAQQAVMARQQQINSLAICTGRKATLRNSIRALKVQIEDMDKDKKTKPATWSPRDQKLLEELEEDLETAQSEFEGLLCRDTVPPQ